MNMNSFDSFVEFGMELAISQQMISFVNEMMNNNQNLVSLKNLQQQNINIFYFMIDNNPAGPYTEEEIVRLVLNKKINYNTYIWKPGMKSWNIAKKLPEILNLFPLTTPGFSTKIFQE